jgi:hypothetical protein
MGMRMDALWRVFQLIWVALIGYVLGAIFGVIGIVFMIIDVIWQMILGTEGLDPNGSVGSWLRGYIKWTERQTVYAITGAGNREWLPSKA